MQQVALYLLVEDGDATIRCILVGGMTVIQQFALYLLVEDGDATIRSILVGGRR